MRMPIWRLDRFDFGTCGHFEEDLKSLPWHNQKSDTMTLRPVETLPFKKKNQSN